MGRAEADRKITGEPWLSTLGQRNMTKENTLRSECGSAFKKRLTEPALLEMSGLRCRLRRSTQHFLEVYSQEFEILKFFWDAGLSAAPLCPDPLANSQTGRCLEARIVVTADWCFRSSRAARDSADRRSRPAHP